MKRETGLALVLFGAVALICTTGCGSQNDVDEMHNALGTGYDLASKKQVEKAGQAFEEAAKYAVKAEDWAGCIQAAYGVANAGRFKDAVPLFRDAAGIASRKKDWRGLVAAGFGLASLPKEQGQLGDATKCFNAAVALALEEKNTQGIMAAGKGLAEADDKAGAADAFDQALAMVKEAKSIEGSQALMGCYESIGEKDKSAVCKDLVREFRRYRAELSKKVEIPPPGWAAAGETVAGPKEYDAALQAARRASADADIAAKAQWILQNERLEAEQRMEAEKYNYMYVYPYQYDWIDRSWGSGWWGSAGYYGGPYFYGHYGAWCPDYYSRWGGYYGSHYRYRDGRWWYY